MAGRKPITDPLSNGKIAKLYFMAYPKKIYGYEVAKEEYPKIDRAYYSRLASRYSDLFNILKKEVNGRNRKYIKSKVAPLLDKIKDTLSKKLPEYKLTPLEVDQLYKFLDGPFREIVKDFNEVPTLEDSLFYIGSGSLGAFRYKHYKENVKPKYKKMKRYLKKAGKDISGSDPFSELDYNLLNKLTYLLPDIFNESVRELYIEIENMVMGRYNIKGFR